MAGNDNRKTEGPEDGLSGEEVSVRVVEALKALAHPIRFRILEILADKRQFGLEDQSCCGRDEVCVCRLNELFDVSAPTMSHHLRLLREADLIEGRRAGVWIYYSIRPEALHFVAAALTRLESQALGACSGV